MPRIIVGVFLVLHGLVHLLYLAHSLKIFELQPGLAWPDGSWAFSRLLGNASTRLLASVLLTLATLGFVVGAAGIFLQQVWWRPVVIGSAISSAALYLLFWDGGMRRLADKGIVGFLINLAILVAVLIFGWPRL